MCACVGLSQEWNEILYNGVYYEPPEGPGAPGEIDPNKKYTFKYPRPPRCALPNTEVHRVLSQ